MLHVGTEVVVHACVAFSHPSQLRAQIHSVGAAQEQCSRCKCTLRMSNATHAGTCDICAARNQNKLTHSDIDCTALAKTVVAAVRDLNARDIVTELATARQLINVRSRLASLLYFNLFFCGCLCSQTSAFSRSCGESSGEYALDRRIACRAYTFA